MLPIGDDNSDRTRFPFINYIIIAINILVFVFLQRLGADIGFTYSHSTVPGEILTGNDIVTDSKIMIDPFTGDEFELPGLGITPGTCMAYTDHFYVHAWWLGTSGRKHAVSDGCLEII